MDIIGCMSELFENEVKQTFKTVMSEAASEQIKDARKSLKRKVAGRMFLLGADRNRYGDMKNNMQLSMAMRNNNYPDSLEETINIMNMQHQQGRKQHMCKKKEGPQDTELNFGQQADLKEITHYHCGEKGHYAKTCPKKKNLTGKVFTHIKEEEWASDDDVEVEYTYH